MTLVFFIPRVHNSSRALCCLLLQVTVHYFSSFSSARRCWCSSSGSSTTGSGRVVFHTSRIVVFHTSRNGSSSHLQPCICVRTSLGWRGWETLAACCVLWQLVEAVLVEEGSPGSGGAYIVTGLPVIHNKCDYRYNKCDHRFRAESAQPPKSPRPAEQLWDYGGSYFIVIIFLLFSTG